MKLYIYICSIFLGRRPSMRDKSTQHDDTTIVGTNFSDIHSFTTNTISTTSSSQTETNLFMPKIPNKTQKYSDVGFEHINANVVRIQLGKNESDTTSSIGISTHTDIKSSQSGESNSIPSSYERQLNLNAATALEPTEPRSNDKAKNSNPSGNSATTENNIIDDLATNDIPPLRKNFTIPGLPSSSPSHNRARRGGIIPKESDAFVHAAANLSKPRAPVLFIPPPPLLEVQNYASNNTRKPSPQDHIIVDSNAIKEFEVQSRMPKHDSSTHAQLQSMPDSIMRVSISS